jgi:8-oxo-dGTP pyrophosphatase MutT (NUDIX family)
VPAPDPGYRRELETDETLVDLRCSVIIVRQESVLLLHRTDADEWVLPGGRPRPGESMISCARREVHEETGLSIVPGRCALVLEVASPDRGSHIVELVFLAAPVVTDYTVHEGEPGRVPVWLPLTDIGSIPLRPPIGGHLRSFLRDSRASAAYLGNVWRPAGADGNDQDNDGAAGTGLDRSSP